MRVLACVMLALLFTGCAAPAEPTVEEATPEPQVEAAVEPDPQPLQNDTSKELVANETAPPSIRQDAGCQVTRRGAYTQFGGPQVGTFTCTLTAPPAEAAWMTVHSSGLAEGRGAAATALEFSDDGGPFATMQTGDDWQGSGLISLEARYRGTITVEPIGAFVGDETFALDVVYGSEPAWGLLGAWHDDSWQTRCEMYRNGAVLAAGQPDPDSAAGVKPADWQPCQYTVPAGQYRTMEVAVIDHQGLTVAPGAELLIRYDGLELYALPIAASDASAVIDVYPGADPTAFTFDVRGTWVGNGEVALQLTFT